jgi:starch-binding outer membrane protein, SusD/RagB family
MKIRLIVSLLVLFQFGCTDLDSDLYDRIPPEEYTADPILRMSPIYAPMRQFIDWGGWWFAQEITGDLVTAPTRGGDWDDGGKWRVLHQHTWTNNTEAINAMWGTYYDGALEANKFIEEMEALAGDPVVDEAIAKARILRAYYYYLLIDNYGHVPYQTSYLDAPQQPMRNFREEIFFELLSEIEESLPLIEPSTSKTGISPAMA